MKTSRLPVAADATAYAVPGGNAPRKAQQKRETALNTPSDMGRTSRTRCNNCNSGSRVHRDVTERAGMAERRAIKDATRADKLRRARLLVQEGLKPSVIVQRTGLSWRTVAELRREVGV